MARAVGRRKTASARVRITPGKGSVMVNGRDYKEYFPLKLLQERVLSPLVALSKEKDTGVSVKVSGGGVHGQADAVCHGIARSLVEWNPDFKPTLKALGLMTRDPRAKERKKPGLHKARRAHQWRKR
ncbi:MAG: 30S ribosomal protein S9 [Candidatus Magasanikbacteria bacterium]|nr:30S ribosomal protein S9 [Candidatus Magasanikbacteria bacterium]